MLKTKKIGVVIPAYNEELLIERVISTMPDYVDGVYVIDDASTDMTRNIVQGIGKGNPLSLISFDENRGVGAAIVAGYQKASEDGMDVVAVMAGDAQMDPNDLQAIVKPVVDGEVDYTKGNRLFYKEASRLIPPYRLFGNSLLSLFTKFSSGYWHIADSQTGYTAISKIAIDTLPLENLYKRYGYPNHILAMLNVYNFKVRDVPVRPVYNIGEKSGIRLWKVIPTISSLLVANFLWRMREKYIFRDFHPLVFFYFSGFSLLLISIPLAVRLFFVWLQTSEIPAINALSLLFTLIMGSQSFFFAMWFDMEYNRDLR